jgi:hypothetical protein
VANSGESQQQCWQRLDQSLPRNQAHLERATRIELAFSAWEPKCHNERHKAEVLLSRESFRSKSSVASMRASHGPPHGVVFFRAQSPAF